MRKTDYEMFMLSLNLNIEIDNSLRRISEKIRLLNQVRDTDNLSVISTLLSNLDTSIDDVINTTCNNE